jgi:hypothetical protein
MRIAMRCVLLTWASISSSASGGSDILRLEVGIIRLFLGIGKTPVGGSKLSG